MLSWHVQKFVCDFIVSNWITARRNSHWLELRAKNFSETGPWNLALENFNPAQCLINLGNINNWLNCCNPHCYPVGFENPMFEAKQGEINCSHFVWWHFKGKSIHSENWMPGYFCDYKQVNNRWINSISKAKCLFTLELINMWITHNATIMHGHETLH